LLTANLYHFPFVGVNKIETATTGVAKLESIGAISGAL
jgi:hypothetical protein